MYCFLTGNSNIVVSADNADSVLNSVLASATEVATEQVAAEKLALA